MATEYGLGGPRRRLAVSVAEAADMVGLGVTKFRQLVRDRRIPIVRIGRRILVPVASLERLLQDSLEQDAGARGNGGKS